MAGRATLQDLNEIYVVVPRDSGGGTVNVTIAQMSDRQFREWAAAKADAAGINMIVPAGRIGYETRVNIINRLIEGGVKIYKVGGAI
jgi:hypothetical protein